LPSRTKEGRTHTGSTYGRLATHLCSTRILNSSGHAPVLGIQLPPRNEDFESSLPGPPSPGKRESSDEQKTNSSKSVLHYKGTRTWLSAVVMRSNAESDRCGDARINAVAGSLLSHLIYPSIRIQDSLSSSPALIRILNPLAIRSVHTS
jgi:hypothetical protein